MSFDQLISMCRGCLATERNMFNATIYETDFKCVTGIRISSSDELPQWLCYECIALLQKCVRFRNKVKESHFTLCQYVQENVPLCGCTSISSYLSRGSVLHYEVPGAHAEQVQEPHNKVVGHIEEMVTTEVESVRIKVENDTERVSCEEDLQMYIGKKSSVYDIAELDMKNICLVTCNHEARTEEEEIKAQIEPVVSDMNSERVTVKDETSSSAYDDNITVEEWCIDQQNELRNKSSTLKLNQDEQNGQEEMVRQLERGTCEATHSVRAAANLDTDISVTSLREKDEEDVKRENENNSNISVNDTFLFSNVKSYICDECNKCFNNKILLIAHIHEHLKQKPNELHESRKGLVTESNLKSHYPADTGKRYKCEVCMKYFAHRTTLRRHKYIHASVKPTKPYQCDVCSKDFNYKAHYDAHNRIHTGEKPYKCDVCMKCFAHKQSFNKHVLIHTGERPYKCGVCMKTFRTAGNLLRHSRLHTGVRPYKCDMCVKSFVSSTGLQLHYRTHTGEKPYKCDICMKCFSTKCSLNVHTRIHTGEKPYKCNVCMKAFVTSGDLKKHSRVHADDKRCKRDI